MEIFDTVIDYDYTNYLRESYVKKNPGFLFLIDGANPQFSEFLEYMNKIMRLLDITLGQLGELSAIVVTKNDLISDFTVLFPE